MTRASAASGKPPAPVTLATMTLEASVATGTNVLNKTSSSRVTLTDFASTRSREKTRLAMSRQTRANKKLSTTVKQLIATAGAMNTPFTTPATSRAKRVLSSNMTSFSISSEEPTSKICVRPSKSTLKRCMSASEPRPTSKRSSFEINKDSRRMSIASS